MAYRRIVLAAVIGLLTLPEAPNFAWSALETCSSANNLKDPISLYGDEIVFSVLRNGDFIGEHRVTFDLDGDRLLVWSRFEARVNLLFITAYEYLYESKSVWRDGCLVELRATTDDNGEKSRVSVRVNTGGLLIEGPSGVTQGTVGLFPTNHWHAGVLDSDRVLNTITGKVANVDIADMGPSTVMVNNSPEFARHYVYSGDLRTEVWYDDHGRWVKMRFQAEDGSRIEYVCQKCRRDATLDPA